MVYQKALDTRTRGTTDIAAGAAQSAMMPSVRVRRVRIARMLRDYRR